MITVDTSLTPKQVLILRTVVGWIEREGYPPTVREIGAEHGIRSPNGVMCHLIALQRKGWIKFGTANNRPEHRQLQNPAAAGYGKARSIVVVGLRVRVSADGSEQGRRLAAAMGWHAEGGGL